MGEEIKVHVVRYKGKRNLMMRYLDPYTGKHVAKTTRTRNRRDAERAAGKWEAELREGRYKKLVQTSWAEFRLKYENEVLPGLAGGTEGNKATVFNHIEKTINPQRVTDLTTPQISKFVATLRAKGMRESTLVGHLAHLKPILKWAVSQGYLRAMPEIPKPERGKGVSQAVRGRALVGEEFDRMLTKVVEKRKRDPEKWKTLLSGLWLSGLRLSEALALSWEEDAEVSVSMSGKYPALRILAEGQKNHQDKLLPIAPEFAEFLLSIPATDRHGLVFGIYGRGNQPLSTKRASRYISAIGKAAGIITNKKEARYATAHDLRRSFGSKWAKLVKPAVLKELMRHSSISTTMTYYVSQDTEEMGDLLRMAVGNTQGNTAPYGRKKSEVDRDTKHARIKR